MTVFQGVRLIYHFLRGAMNPSQLKHSLNAGELLCNTGRLQGTIERVAAVDPEFFRRKNIRYGYRVSDFKDYPIGTLGRTYHDHMVRLGLDPEALPTEGFHDESSYLEYLVRKTHDVWHVITGFDASLTGEIGLQAFKFRQMNWAFAMLAIPVGCLVTLFKNPSEMPRLAEEMGRGFDLAKRYKLLITVDWNQYWATPLEQVRSEISQPA